MYYVVYVGTGQEDKAQLLMGQLLPDNLYEECFYPTRIMRKKIRGTWITTRERLTPGYLFIRTDHIVDFFHSLRAIPTLTQLLGMEKDAPALSIPEDQIFYCLPPKEEEWLLSFTSQTDGSEETAIPSVPAKDYIIGLSQVTFDENDQVIVVSGPLKGMEGKVKKMNLHKRHAEVEVEFMGRKTTFYMGIEILDKA